MSCVRSFGEFDLPVESFSGDVITEGVVVVGESGEGLPGLSEFS